MVASLRFVVPCCALGRRPLRTSTTSGRPCAMSYARRGCTSARRADLCCWPVLSHSTGCPGQTRVANRSNKLSGFASAVGGCHKCHQELPERRVVRFANLQRAPQTNSGRVADTRYVCRPAGSLWNRSSEATGCSGAGSPTWALRTVLGGSVPIKEVWAAESNFHKVV